MYKELNIEDVIVMDDNHRSYFDEKSLIELSESIKKHGLIEPIIVREVPGMPFGTHQLVSGERRLRAHVIAGLKTIECAIRVYTDDEVLEIQIAENLHRENPNPLDEATAFKMMKDRKHYTFEEIAARINKTPAFVRSRIILNDLIEDAKQLLYSGILPVTHASKIAALQPKKQTDALKRVIIYDGDKKAIGHYQIADLNGWLKDSLIRELEKAPFDTEDETLVPSAGSCGTCTKCTMNLQTLFEEEKGCLDSICYMTKVREHVNRRIIQIKAKNKGVEPKQVSDVYFSTEPGLINTSAYQERSKKEKCPNCVLGVITHSESNRQGEQIYVCQYSVCPQSEQAEEQLGATTEDTKAQVIKKHAESINDTLSNQQVYDQQFDRKMLQIVEYLDKWTEIPQDRQQVIINKLKWSCDMADPDQRSGPDMIQTSDITLCNEQTMFYDNFHGKEEEKELINREFSLYILMSWDADIEIYSEIQKELLADTLVPALADLRKKNAKQAKKLSEFYADPKLHNLVKLTKEEIMLLYKTIDGIKTLGKKFAIQLSDDKDPEVLSEELITKATSKKNG